MFKVGDRIRLKEDPRWVGTISELMWGDSPDTAAINWRRIDRKDTDFSFTHISRIELIPVANDILKDLCSK